MPDVWAAFNTRQKTLIPTESWVENDSITFVAHTGDLDDYCNLPILFFARIVNLMASPHIAPGDPGVVALIEELWGKLQQWHSCRPEKARPLARVDLTGINPFPHVIYAQSSPSKVFSRKNLCQANAEFLVCGNTFYHAGSLLLLRSGLMRSFDSNLEQVVAHMFSLACYSVA